jgi:hypothetical protein
LGISGPEPDFSKCLFSIDFLRVLEKNCDYLLSYGKICFILPLVVGENFAFTRQGKILRFFTPQVKIL